MTERYIIDNNNEYIVQVFGNSFVEALPEGAIEVTERPSPWYDYSNGSWVENTDRKDTMVSAEVRSNRDYKLLTEVDPIAGNALRWAALSTAQQQDLASYREMLLNVPQQAGFPHSVTWPTKPSFL